MITEAGKYVLEKLLNTPEGASIAGLAKVSYKERPDLFKDSEAARRLFNYYLQRSGKADCRKVSVRNPWKSYEKEALPIEYPKLQTKYVMPSAHKKIGVLADVHCPFHDSVALQTAVDCLKYDYDVDAVLLNGDIVDEYWNSTFLKLNSQVLSYKEEHEKNKQMFRWLRGQFPNAEIFYKRANHEDRLEKIIARVAPHLLQAQIVSFVDAYDLDTMSYHMIDSWTYIKIGKLNVIHGHEVRMGGINVNAARTLWLKMKDNALCSHVHKVSNHTETDVDGNVYGTYSTGCLCTLSPEFMPISNNWLHGFAHIKVADDGYFELNNHMILDRNRVV